MRARPEMPFEVAREARGLGFVISAIAVDGRFLGACSGGREELDDDNGFLVSVEVEGTRGLGAVGLVVATLFARWWAGAGLGADERGLPFIRDSLALLELV